MRIGQPAAVIPRCSMTSASAGAMSGAAATVSVPPATWHSSDDPEPVTVPEPAAAAVPDARAVGVGVDAEPKPDAVLAGSADPERTSQVITPAAATSATTKPTMIMVRLRAGVERWRPCEAAGGWSVMTSATPLDDQADIYRIRPD
jgi:hypothetical protein